MPHTCTDPHHHVHDAASFVAAVERACRERGLRLTPIRARVLGLIAEHGKPIKAYDLLDHLRADKARAGARGNDEEAAGAAAPPTVYRALDFLLANGFIHKLESVNAFVACHHPNSAQHSVPFLICDRCHAAVELEDRRIVALLDEQARALGFVPQAQTLEVHGLCARCAA
jgi:Fur family zinc uptake transcriptional regulator